MRERSKRYLEAQKLKEDKEYSLREAIECLKKMPSVKFDETVEISCKLGVDPQKSDQMVRGSTVLPHGRGKTVRVLVFCEPDREKEAKEAGADYVGGQDLVDKIQKENWLDFDYCISTPGMMRIVSKLGKILGPRGLMPSPKTGSITENISYAIKEAKLGKLDFRLDKSGCINVAVGKKSFTVEQLVENANSFLKALLNARPSSVKGEYIKSIYCSTTMSPALKIDLKEVKSI